MRTILRRLAQLIVVVIIVTFFTSVLTALLPGDPVTTIAPFASPEQRAAIKHQNHLDENIFLRYKDWAKDFFRGDLGRFYAGNNIKGEEVYNVARRAVPKSLLLVLYIEVLTVLIAVPLGVVMAYRAGSMIDQAASTLVFLLLAIPTFVAAAIFQLWFGVKWGWFPTTGWTDLGKDPILHLKHVAMPVLAVTIGQVAVYSRLLRSDMVATLQEDYILMAKSKGIPNRRILWRHALRPSSLTLLTVAGLNFGALIGGLLIVESIFTVGGLGSQIFDAIQQRQYIALQSYIAIVAILYVLVNFLVDVLYTVLDPRIRGARIG